MISLSSTFPLLLAHRWLLKHNTWICLDYFSGALHQEEAVIGLEYKVWHIGDPHRSARKCGDLSRTNKDSPSLTQQSGHAR
jgi:hypothetical protein